MKTHILPESEVEAYYKNVIKPSLEESNHIEHALIQCDLMGLEYCEIEEAKTRARVGDCLLFEYDGMYLPFQIVHKYPADKENPHGRCIFTSYHILDNHIFDEKTNVWKNSSIRKYMNEDMSRKFNPEFLKYVKDHETHTDDYTTTDKFFLLSHEEIGYNDDNHMFKENKGAICFDYYKENAKEAE